MVKLHEKIKLPNGVFKLSFLRFNKHFNRNVYKVKIEGKYLVGEYITADYSHGEYTFERIK